MVECLIKEKIGNGDVVSIQEANDYMKEELWIQDNKYNGEDVTFIHWYNKQFYIIQTN